MAYWCHEIIGTGLRFAYSVAPSSKQGLALAQAIRAFAVMPSSLPVAFETRWSDDGAADQIWRFTCTETAARQQIATDAPRGMDFIATENAFDIWLRLQAGVGRADLICRVAGRYVGIIPSDAFTTNCTPREYVRVHLGGSITRDALRSSHDIHGAHSGAR